MPRTRLEPIMPSGAYCCGGRRSGTGECHGKCFIAPVPVSRYKIELEDYKDYFGHNCQASGIKLRKLTDARRWA